MNEKDYKLSPEYRKLLAKDLYQRLGTKTLVQDMKYIKTNRPIPIWQVDTILEEVRLFADEPWQPIYSVRPYLRPMSSMTDEEKKEFCEKFECVEVNPDDFGYTEGGTLEDYISTISFNLIDLVIDWLIEHKFDFRGLIPMGLALEAKEDMYRNE